jgi:hypothetical protein
MKVQNKYHLTWLQLMFWVHITHLTIHYWKGLPFFRPPTKWDRIPFLHENFRFAMYSPIICDTGISTKFYHPSIKKDIQDNSRDRDALVTCVWNLQLSESFHSSITELNTMEGLSWAIINTNIEIRQTLLFEVLLEKLWFAAWILFKTVILQLLYILVLLHFTSEAQILSV